MRFPVDAEHVKAISICRSVAGLDVKVHRRNERRKAQSASEENCIPSSSLLDPLENPANARHR